MVTAKVTVTLHDKSKIGMQTKQETHLDVLRRVTEWLAGKDFKRVTITTRAT